MSMISISNLKKVYGKGETSQTVLDNISLNIGKNKFVSILGRSGSGKTTLLNIISTLIKFDSGKVVINGEDISEMSTLELDNVRNKNVGYIFQSFNLVSDMSALDNVSLPLILDGVPLKEAHERSAAVLAKVELDQFMKLRPDEMSGGQKQRVAIARAIVNDQAVLLCDEPTGALDQVTSTIVMELLKELSKERTVIMVTHDEEYALKYSDRIIMLHDGKILNDIDNSKPIEDDKVVVKKKVEDEEEVEPISPFKYYLNILLFSLIGMQLDVTKMKKTFRIFSITLALFITTSVVSQNLGEFTNSVFASFFNNSTQDSDTILEIIYVFIEQNLQILVNIGLYVLLFYSIISFLFVFTINVTAKKREIAVLRTFGASPKKIAMIFSLKPIRYLVNIYKNALIFTFIFVLLVNDLFDFKSFISAEYFDFVSNIFSTVFYVIIGFLLNYNFGDLTFPIHYVHIIPLFIGLTFIFVIGSVVPAVITAKQDTIKTLAKE